MRKATVHEEASVDFAAEADRYCIAHHVPGNSCRKSPFPALVRRPDTPPPPLPFRPREPPLHSRDLVGAHAHGDVDAAVFARLARHHFGVLIEPVQPLPVIGREVEVDQRAAACEARSDMPLLLAASRAQLVSA